MYRKRTKRNKNEINEFKKTQRNKKKETKKTHTQTQGNWPDYESNMISVLQAARRQTRYRRSWPDIFRGVFRGRSCRRRRRQLSSSVAITRPEWDMLKGLPAMRCRRTSARKRGGIAWRITRITRTTLRVSRTVRGAEPDSISSPVNPWAPLIFHFSDHFVSWYFITRVFYYLRISFYNGLRWKGIIDENTSTISRCLISILI